MPEAVPDHCGSELRYRPTPPGCSEAAAASRLDTMGTASTGQKPVVRQRYAASNTLPLLTKEESIPAFKSEGTRISEGRLRIIHCSNLWSRSCLRTGWGGFLSPTVTFERISRLCRVTAISFAQTARPSDHPECVQAAAHPAPDAAQERVLLLWLARSRVRGLSPVRRQAAREAARPQTASRSGQGSHSGTHTGRNRGNRA